MSSNALDKIVSRLLRYDLTRTDILKWVTFARNLLALLVVAILSVAGLAAFLSTRQASILLRRSLAAQGEAIGKALARGSFVPLTLQDKAGLARVMETYKEAENLNRIEILDKKGLSWFHFQKAGSAPRAPAMVMTFLVLPLVEPGENPPAPAAEIGTVVLAMSLEEIHHKSRTIALLNLGVGGVLALVVLGVGFLITGRLIQGMHSLVDEARLTEELKRANTELEAFSYSVSHDLRAPLRHVDGFSQALLEDYQDKLDTQGRDFLNRIRSGCQRMGRLIDDLLNLSRVVRQEIKVQALDLGEIVRGVAESLRSVEPDRKVVLKVVEKAPALGDPGLLRAALENLVGNAWKFTQKTEAALIEFGITSALGAPAYFVRDNGAGFDMKYAGKLFAPFQRLHSDKDYAGTGIGLATVQRIIHRHGGRIWAEGILGGGATFYFTLKNQEAK